MAPIVWTDVTDMAGEFISPVTPASVQTLWLALVNGSGVNAINYGGEDADKTKTARILLAAHFETMRRRQGTGGGINSQSEGDVSQSYYNAWKNPRALDMTSYGQMFKAITMGTPARAGFLA